MPGHKNKTAGFTILELAACIVIIGILALIMSASYAGMTDRARISSLKANLKRASAKIEVYSVDYGYYPAEGSNFINQLLMTDGIEYDYDLSGDTYRLTAISTTNHDLKFTIDENSIITEGE